MLKLIILLFFGIEIQTLLYRQIFFYLNRSYFSESREQNCTLVVKLSMAVKIAFEPQVKTLKAFQNFLLMFKQAG